jgi:hypothetical protein
MSAAGNTYALLIGINDCEYEAFAYIAVIALMSKQLTKP